ncbi:MAG TPA: helix-turn-helix domain-containing protein [Gemmatimonadaceae bacterium]|nr:helix-turn-helix domain-containing protein [Gemmatimonadaceae bacterium]
MDIKPIKTESDYDAALAEIDNLMDAEPETPDGDRLDVLVTLVEAYEEKHWAISPPDPIEAIKLRMEQRGLSRTELGRILGCSSGRVSEILNRKRPLSVGMMRKAHTDLDIPAESLLLARQRTHAKGRKRSGKATGAASKGRRKHAA